MSVRKLVPLLAALALAGCGEEKVAEAPAPEETASISRAVQPEPARRTPAYRAGDVILRLGEDGVFSMDEVGGSRRIEGRYTVQDGVLTLSQGRGDVGNTKFPVRCRIQHAGDSFTLTGIERACAVLHGVTFRPAH